MKTQDPGSRISRDVMHFLASCFPGFLTKFLGIFSAVTQSKMQKIFVRSTQALDWFLCKTCEKHIIGHCDDTPPFVLKVACLASGCDRSMYTSRSHQARNEFV